MSKPIGRHSIGMMMVFVALFSGGLGTMRGGSELAEESLFGVTLLVLGTGLLGAVVRRWESRWVGFSLFGWGYFLLASLPTARTDGGPMWPRLITSTLLARLAEDVYPYSSPGPAVPLAPSLDRFQFDFERLLNLGPGDAVYASLPPTAVAELKTYQSEMRRHREAATANALGQYILPRAGHSMLTLAFALLGSFIAPILGRPRGHMIPASPTPG